MMELVGRGSVTNRATTSSSNIRVDFIGRCREGSEALPVCSTDLGPAPAYAPASAHAPATVQPKEKLCLEEIL